MLVKPLRENVLVKRVEEENKTAGGIILPDTAKEKPQEVVTNKPTKQVLVELIKNKTLFKVILSPVFSW